MLNDLQQCPAGVLASQSVLGPSAGSVGEAERLEGRAVVRGALAVAARYGAARAVPAAPSVLAGAAGAQARVQEPPAARARGRRGPGCRVLGRGAGDKRETQQFAPLGALRGEPVMPQVQHAPRAVRDLEDPGLGPRARDVRREGARGHGVQAHGADCIARVELRRPAAEELAGACEQFAPAGTARTAAVCETPTEERVQETQGPATATHHQPPTRTNPLKELVPDVAVERQVGSL
mmetsp:Transcript_73634/g.203263  ORF Transcript_73634/g.203263 Transcript_73634/m.203263 type:complete len:236 (-) Transcript_73634:331-1038(-)